MATGWEQLAVQLVKRWRTDELILLAEEDGDERLREDLADFLAGRAGLTTDGAVIADWLLDRDDVEDVLCDDDTLTATLAEEARRVAGAMSEEAPDEEAVADRERRERVEARLPGLLSELGRRPRRPRIESGDGWPTASKYGGTPLLGEEEPWPTCENCDEPMHLLAQLDLAMLPDGAHGVSHGWVQLFYCVSADPPCELDCEAWSPGAASTLVRWIEGGDAREIDDDEHALPPNPDFTPSIVVGWADDDDELPAFGDSDALTKILGDEDIDYQDLSELGATAAPGDKVGGWPAWLGAPAYPRCPECRKPMSYFLQLESKGLSGHVFGGADDLTRGHAFQCVRHPEYVAFRWAGPGGSPAQAK